MSCFGDESQVSATPLRFQTGSDQAPTPPPGSSPRRLIVETAWDLFARHGYDTVRIVDIAEAAGVSNASIHYYFNGKSDLFDAALDYSVKLAFDRQVAWLGETSASAAVSLSCSMDTFRPVSPTSSTCGFSGRILTRHPRDRRCRGVGVLPEELCRPR